MSTLSFDFGGARGREVIAPGATLLRGFALPFEDGVWKGVETVAAAAAFRHMVTPGGFEMSVAMTNCGPLGWVTDTSGYRYAPRDPLSGKAWPSFPGAFLELAREAARAGGFEGFEPDACLVNEYVAGAKMSLHQDRNERDFGAPIVSVSLGLPAVFLFGGEARGDKTTKHRLEHGDVVVWGGPSRLRFHGVKELEGGHHPKLGARRINLTFRTAA